MKHERIIIEVSTLIDESFAYVIEIELELELEME